MHAVTSSQLQRTRIVLQNYWHIWVHLKTEFSALHHIIKLGLSISFTPKPACERICDIAHCHVCSMLCSCVTDRDIRHRYGITNYWQNAVTDCSTKVHYYMLQFIAFLVSFMQVVQRSTVIRHIVIPHVRFTLVHNFVDKCNHQPIMWLAHCGQIRSKYKLNLQSPRKSQRSWFNININ